MEINLKKGQRVSLKGEDYDLVEILELDLGKQKTGMRLMTLESYKEKMEELKQEEEQQ